ncbi:hypothetical protein [Streptomyces sp. NPDC058955]|uniref:hypothetical protein n=1 Tax=Streptomyces sp. NPDC058955 TaxID=3346678 RepID=UPI0036B0E86A
MAVKTIWPIDHSCGHHSDQDLSGGAAARRAGGARGRAPPACTRAPRAAPERPAPRPRAWLETKRAEEHAASEAWSQQYRMPPLEGTERAVSWGVRCRHQILAAAYTALVVEGDTSEVCWEAIEESARTITRAGWWIDQRSFEPEDLPELIQAATDADRPTENPYF